MPYILKAKIAIYVSWYTLIQALPVKNVYTKSFQNILIKWSHVLGIEWGGGNENMHMMNANMYSEMGRGFNVKIVSKCVDTKRGLQ